MAGLVEDFNYTDEVAFFEAGWISNDIANNLIEIDFDDSYFIASTTVEGNEESSVLGSWNKIYDPGGLGNLITIRGLDVSGAFPLVDNGDGVGFYIAIFGQWDNILWVFSKRDGGVFVESLGTGSEFESRNIVPDSFIDEVTIVRADGNITVNVPWGSPLTVADISLLPDTPLTIQFGVDLSRLHDGPGYRQIRVDAIEVEMSSARVYHTPTVTGSGASSKTYFTGAA